ncbi:MAG: ABC transporter ATP-binding protein [Clostridiales bacterium]|jgi:ABC-2 type transport system ATP-binding protein|nr:ABC transporter ATP-binding protein [Clostridiales bacterium]
MNDTDIVLSSRGLTKRYGQKLAVNSVDMTVRRGDIYGFIGLNGSGKTTFIRMVTGLIMPTFGSYSLFNGSGRDANRRSMRRISSMVETPAVYQNLSGADNLRLQCDIAGDADRGTPARLLSLVGLDPKSKVIAKSYSLGMRQRLGIAMALVGSPELMLLDEPTNGLDPEGIVEIRQLLQKLNREMGITILISSHILTELSKLATTYGFIHDGFLLQEVSVKTLAESAARTMLRTSDDKRAFALLNGRFACRETVDGIEILDDISVTALVVTLLPEKIAVYSANKTLFDLESYFMRLIGGLSHGQPL